MIEKIKDLLNRIEEGDEEAKKELIEILKKDEVMIESFVEIIAEQKPITSDDETEEDEQALTLEQWEAVTKKYAESKNGQRCSSQSITNTYKQALALYQAGENLKDIIDACKKELVVLGIKDKDVDSVNFAKKDESLYSEIARMFEPAR